LRLANLAKKLNEGGIRVIVSNSDTEFTREVFEGLYRYSVVARRSIGAKASYRLPVRELIATNVELGQSEVLNLIEPI
jgi:site-specific DNA-adenine methylase